MAAIVIKPDHQFDRLTVIRELDIHIDNRGRRFRTFLCQCRCDGNTKSYRLADLRTGNTKSCGCIALETLQARSITHGQARVAKQTRTYHSWCYMIQRCTNPNVKAYVDYGGRGIRICQDWLSFENFFRDMGECPAGLTLERKENDSNYEPGNCYWATRKEQARNRRSSHWLTFKGETLPLATWAERFGLGYDTFYQQLKRHKWSIKSALDPSTSGMANM